MDLIFLQYHLIYLKQQQNYGNNERFRTGQHAPANGNPEEEAGENSENREEKEKKEDLKSEKTDDEIEEDRKGGTRH